MKHTLAIAAIGLCLAFAECFSKVSAVKPVGDELPLHELDKIIAGSWIGPDEEELTIKVVEGPLPLEISTTHGVSKQRGTITALADSRSPTTFILWIKDPEKDEYQFFRISCSSLFIDGSKSTYLVLLYPDERLVRALVGSGKIIEMQDSAPRLKPDPGWVLLDDPKIAGELKTKEFWSIDLSLALVSKQKNDDESE